jgi:hypothetical protein
MAFTKLDSHITKSSLWSEGLHVRVVFVTFLAEKDENGIVEAAPSSMQRLCNVTKEQFEDAIKILESPDPESRTEEFEGRRIEKIEGGWIVLNHEKYRLREDVKRENRRDYMKNYMRNKRNVNNVNINKKLTGVNNGLTSVSVSESISVSESVSKNKNKDTSVGTKSKKEKPKWKQNYEVYKNDAESAYRELISDLDWLKDREKYHPGLDVLLSLEKAFVDYWGTEAGWNHKKKSKADSINWKTTYQNALTMKCNQVWKDRNNKPKMAGLL